MKFLLPILIVIFLLSCSDEKEIGIEIPNQDNPYIPKQTDNFDPFFQHQWHLHSEQYFSVNILGAWEITKGAGVRIAVLDDNIQRNHEDFEAIFVYNVVNGSNSIEPVRRNAYSHGTAVAGVVSARWNDVGTIGVAPESDMLFIGDPNFFSEDADVIRALDKAREWGAQVINCSWGGGLISESFESQMRSLYKSGVVVVFATGNRGWNLDNQQRIDESELPWVIGVSASDRNGMRRRDADFGSKLDIMAPGTSILILDLMGADGSNNSGGLANENYGISNGTSFAAPIVAGVAALMLAVNPTLTATQVRQIITETAQKTGGDEVMYDGNGFSLSHAYGLIDAERAVQRARDWGNGSSITRLFR
jgi:subtilisin family serine protease